MNGSWPDDRNDEDGSHVGPKAFLASADRHIFAIVPRGDGRNVEEPQREKDADLFRARFVVNGKNAEEEKSTMI